MNEASKEKKKKKKKKKSLRDIGFLFLKFLFLQNIIFIILMDFLNKKIITKI